MLEAQFDKMLGCGLNGAGTDGETGEVTTATVPASSSPWDRFYVVRFDSSMDTFQAASRLKADPSIEDTPPITT